MSQSVANGALPRSAAGTPWRHPAFRFTLIGAAFAALILTALWDPLAAALTDAEFGIATLLPRSWLGNAAWFAVPALALMAGLLASVSPCVLPLVPLNVAFIGAADASGWRAVSLSARFVLGAALALSLLGLATDLAGFVLIEQRGPVLVIVGAAMAYLGLAAVELVPLPFVGRTVGAGRSLGPVAAGAAFSLVTSPCASPLLAGVLAASATSPIPGFSALSMLCFALGYSALVFLAGVFGGTLVRRLRRRSFEAPRAAAAALLLVVGIGFTLAGLAWF